MVLHLRRSHLRRGRLYEVNEENGYWYCGNCDSDDEYSSGQPVVTQGPPLVTPQPNPSSQFENRRRNVQDLQTLRKAYPAHCTHHLFYHHVLQQPTRGCNLVPAEAAGCNQGGKFRSHDMPDDLADQICTHLKHSHAPHSSQGKPYC